MSGVQVSLGLPVDKKTEMEEALLTPRALKVEGTATHCWSLTYSLRDIWKSEESTLQMFMDTLTKLRKHRAWTIIPTEKPYGTEDAMVRDVLGVPLKQALAVLEARGLKQKHQRDAVPEAQEPKAGPGRGHKTEAENDKTSCLSVSSAEAKKDVRIRSINRAAQAHSVIGDLYDKGLIGQAEAALLGPSDTKAEKQPGLRDVISDLVEEVTEMTRGAKSHDPKVMRKVNKRVKEVLKPPDPAKKAVRAISGIEDTEALAKRLLMAKELKHDRLVDLVVSIVEQMDDESFGKVWGRLSRINRAGRR